MELGESREKKGSLVSRIEISLSQFHRLGRLKILGGTENAVEFYVAKNQPRNQKSTEEGNDPPLSLFWTFDFLP